jgi:oligopeptidase B
VHHGHDFLDRFDWMREKESPELVAHLTAENAHADVRTAHLEPLRARIVEEIRARTQETDSSVPVRKDGWWYYSRTTEGLQYPTWHRAPDDGSGRPDPAAPVPGERLILDGNAAAEGQEFFKVSEIAVAPNARLAASGVDLDGGELFDVRVLDLDTGETVDSAVTKVGYGLAWTADSARLIYVRTDDAWRPCEVWSHVVGGPTDHDTLLLREDDERFWTWIDTSRDGRLLVVHHAATTSTEAKLIDLTSADLAPSVVAPRREKLEYLVEAAADHLLVVHNLRQRDFTLSLAPIGGSEPEEWTEVLAAADGERLLAAHAFAGHAVLELRSGGLPALRVLPRVETGAASDAASGEAGDASAAPAYGPARDVVVPGELTTVGLGDVREYVTDEILLETESFVQPPSVHAYGLATGLRELVKQQAVPGHDPERYVERREWATASDGTRIPLSVVHLAGIENDGTAPGLLWGYGAYEVSVDPYFTAERLPVLDRGVVFALAHVRGGGELGRSWYEDGKLDKKRNTFTDFVDAAHFLLDEGFVARGRLAAQGRSAGGLLMGAITNLAPETFRVVHAGVPFVDALTTMLDPSLPLTTGEWEEWGDPLHDPEFYDYMASYAPYDNLAPASYPAILATTSLNDIRVLYVEPAKWIARLREVTTSDPVDRPVLLRCEMVAGHGGRSGRYDRWAERAWEWAFILDQLGAGETDPDPAA